MKILFIGESWHIHMIHSKGYDSFTSSKYEEGATFLLNCLREKGVAVDYMPAHTVQVAFPQTDEELAKYDVIVISDIGANTFLLQNDTFYNMKVLPNALGLAAGYRLPLGRRSDRKTAGASSWNIQCESTDLPYSRRKAKPLISGDALPYAGALFFLSDFQFLKVCINRHRT